MANMQKALVTGGCGFLGSSIVRDLVERGVRTRVLALPGEPTDNIDGLDVELLHGNVLDLDVARRAVEGVDTVFHAAAIYKGYMVDPTLMYDVNMRGTFNMLEASRRAGTARVVYTASIAAIGRPPKGELGNEQTPYDGWEVDFAYGRSKYHSRVLAQDFGRWGLDVRIICPGIVLGPRDIAPTPSGKLILSAVQLGSGLYTQGGASYVDVRDAASAHVLAAERGRPGEMYIATAHNLSHKDFLSTIARVVGMEVRMVPVPYALAVNAVRAVHRRAVRRGEEPPIAAQMFEYGKRPNYYSNEKAKRELGVQFRGIEETIRDAVDYFRHRGLLVK
jgi:dihydroflavonol-4-reductase